MQKTSQSPSYYAALSSQRPPRSIQDRVEMFIDMLVDIGEFPNNSFLKQDIANKVTKLVQQKRW